MKMPFSTEQFFEVFKNYNLSVFPMQIIFYMLACIAVLLAIKPLADAGKIISGILAILWLWMGIAYHLLFFTAINPAAYVFGAFFILQGILFLFFGLLKDQLSFSLHADRFGTAGIILLLFSLVIYPVIGYFAGHRYPFAPTFGLPCPTTIFTFGMLLLTDKKLPGVILIIPFLWSILGFTAVLNFGVTEDTGLLIAGIVAVPMLLLRNRMFLKTNLSAAA